MIASVRGEVVTRLAGEVVIEAAGVGYRMAVSTETLAKVPASPSASMSVLLNCAYRVTSLMAMTFLGSVG